VAAGLSGKQNRMTECGCSASAITLNPPLKHDPEHRLETRMADHGEVQYASATGNDYPAHEQTYRSFVTLVKVSLAAIVVILIIMAFFLT
jgi:aa3 type cytochrome c oxidase subunit IV